MAKVANFLSDTYAILQYCYEHDEWGNSEEILETRLMNDSQTVEKGRDEVC